MPTPPQAVAPGMARTQLLPSAEHPITVDPTGSRVTVTVRGHVVADSEQALTLQESTYPAVLYIPLADVDQSVLSDSTTRTYCPFKGEASYYDVTVDGVTDPDVIWTYRTPYDAVAPIATHVAFYPNKAEITVA